MKKIIAAAVAAAFVAPAAFADVSVTGTFSQYLIDNTTSVAADGQEMMGSETNIKISASTEANNGLTVKGDFTLTQAGGDYFGEGITLSHAAIGSIQIGNPAGAVDAIDDRAEVLQLMDPTTGSSDSSILWTLPTLVDGLSLYVSYAPKNGDDSERPTGSILNGTINYTGDGSADDESGMALAYSTGPVRVAYGTNEQSNEENTFLGLQLSYAGFMVAYEQNEEQVTVVQGTRAVGKYEHDAIGATYTMGDLSIRGLTTSTETGGATTIDRTAYGIHYKLGGGATFMIEAGSEDKAATSGEFTAVGVSYAF